eukprot:3890712-Amphidinium_carterae.1
MGPRHQKRDGSDEANTPGRKSRRHHRSETPPPPPTARSSAGDTTVSVLDKLDQLLAGQQDFARRFDILEGNVQQQASRITRLEKTPAAVDALTSRLDGLVLGQDKKFAEFQRKLEELQLACKSNVGGASQRAVSAPSRSELDKLARTLVVSGWKEPQSREHLEEWVRTEMELSGDHAVAVSQLFDTRARVVFTSSAEATEKHGLFREKKPSDRGCKIFVNRAQTADRQKGDFILRRLLQTSRAKTFDSPTGQKCSIIKCELWHSCVVLTSTRERRGDHPGTGPSLSHLQRRHGDFDIQRASPMASWRASCFVGGNRHRLRGGASFSKLCGKFDHLIAHCYHYDGASEGRDSIGSDIDITQEELAVDTTVADQHAFDFKLPRVITWNSRALFASSSDLARGKLRVLADLQDHGDIMCIQETHQGRGAESAVLSSKWQRFSSPLNPRAGGVMVLIRKAWLSDGHWRASSSVIVPGRAMGINLSSARSRTKLVVICAHIEKTEDGSPEDVLRATGIFVTEARQRNALVLGCGDFNFDLDADRVDAHGNLLPKRGASLARLWHRYFLDCTVPLIDSPTHLHGDGTLAKIDFHFLSLAPAS